jgi:hypothetical protein
VLRDYECSPTCVPRGGGVFNYKDLSLAAGGILAVLRELLPVSTPKSFPLWGFSENFYLESDVYEPTAQDLQGVSPFVERSCLRVTRNPCPSFAVPPKMKKFYHTSVGNSTSLHCLVLTPTCSLRGWGSADDFCSNKKVSNVGASRCSNIVG